MAVCDLSVDGSICEREARQGQWFLASRLVIILILVIKRKLSLRLEMRLYVGEVRAKKRLVSDNMGLGFKN